jgi:hypothetical protein
MRCKPLKMLGSGGQGRVYSFWDRDANAEVALKIGVRHTTHLTKHKNNRIVHIYRSISVDL